MFAEVHGENPTQTDLALIYTTAIAGTGLLVFFVLRQNNAFSWVQWLVFCGIALDIIGGAVANTTRSTNSYYRNKPLRVSVVFLILHIVQPALLAVTNIGGWTELITLYAYTLLAGGLVLSQAHQPHQRPLASALVVIGILLNHVLFQPEILIAWFAPLYLYKLVAAFSITQFPEDE